MSNLDPFAIASRDSFPASDAAAVTIDAESRGKLVYNKLSEALIQGRLQPDERLKIRDLADAMGTSVTPVRDAVIQLVQDGALVMRSPRDIRVRSIGRKEYLEIRDIRVELEGMAAAAAATKVVPEEIERMRNLISANELALRERRFVDAVRLNQAFHFEYCRVADMPNLLEILRRLWLKMGPLIAQSYEKGGRDMVDYHYPLIDALLRTDARAARNAVQTDIISGGRTILESSLLGSGRS